MNDEHLRRIRKRLDEQVRKQYADAGDVNEGMLGALEATEQVGRAKNAEAILQMFPEPEADVVQDYRAVCRVLDLDFSYGYDGPVPEDSKMLLGRKRGELKQEAIEVIRDRLEWNEIEQHEEPDRYILKDPVSKMKMQVAGSVGPERRKLTEKDLAHQILNMGVDQ